MSGQEISIKSRDGDEFIGYLALPEGGTGPGVVVIQEIFGVNEVMRGLTDDWAAAGYVALCPDLFWRQEPGIQITDQTEAEWARAFELFNGFDLEKGVEDLDVTIEHLRGLDAAPARSGPSASAWWPSGIPDGDAHQCGCRRRLLRCHAG